MKNDEGNLARRKVAEYLVPRVAYFVGRGNPEPYCCLLRLDHFDVNQARNQRLYRGFLIVRRR